jgi:hypothetical protein
MDTEIGAGATAGRGPLPIGAADALPGLGTDRCWDAGAVTVVLPALNEAAALPAALGSFPRGVDLVVVDNGSTDATAEVATAHGARVVHEPRRGFGAACWAGVLASPHAEVIAFADADGSFDGADLAAVAGPVVRGEADLVLGSRLLGRRDRGAMSPLAVAENRILGLLSAVLFGVRISDLGPFRALRRATLLSLGVQDRGSGWPLEMVGRAAAAGLRVGEVPVRYRRRAGGSSKVSGSLTGTVRATIAMLAVCWRLRHLRRGRVPWRAAVAAPETPRPGWGGSTTVVKLARRLSTGSPAGEAVHREPAAPTGPSRRSPDGPAGESGVGPGDATGDGPPGAAGDGPAGKSGGGPGDRAEVVG